MLNSSTSRSLLLVSLLGLLFFLKEPSLYASPFIVRKKTLIVQYVAKANLRTNVVFTITAGNEIKEVKIKSNGTIITGCPIIGNRGDASFKFNYKGQKKLTFVGKTATGGDVLLYGTLMVGNAAVVAVAASSYTNDESRRTVSENVPLSTEQCRMFIDNIKPDVVELARRYNVAASVIMGMAVLESRYGTSKVASNANNLFGLKYWGNLNTAVAYQLVDQPYEGSNFKRDIKAKQRTDNWYRKFNSRRECIAFLVEELFLHKTGKWKNNYSSITRKYQQNIASGMAKEAAVVVFLNEIIKNGYTGKRTQGEGDYPLRVLSTIKNNNLFVLD